MSYDPADVFEEDARLVEAQKAQDQRARFEAADWKWLMSQKRGRRLVWRLLSMTGLYRSSFTGNSQTFFNEGERNVGLKVLNAVTQAAPESYIEMLTEQREYE